MSVNSFPENLLHRRWCNIVKLCPFGSRTPPLGELGHHFQNPTDTPARRAMRAPQHLRAELSDLFAS